MDNKGEATAFQEYIYWIIIIAIGITLFLFFPKIVALFSAAWEKITNILPF